MRLDRDARVREGPRRTESSVDHARVVAAAGCAEEAALGLEDVPRGGEPVAREGSREDAALGRTTGVERLGHRAEVLAQAARLAGGDAERDRGVARVEPEQSRRRGPG